jgi:hypothetical protein
MDNRIYAVLIVLTIDLLAAWLLWPKLSGYFLTKEPSPLELKLVRFLVMPSLANVTFLLVFGLLENVITGNQAAVFLDHLYRFALVTMTCFMGLDGLLRATIVWPKRNENAKTITVFYFLIAIAAFTFLALGILLLIKFFQFH